MNTFNNIVLALSGLALFYVCTMRLMDPSAAVFLQTYLEGTGQTITTEMASEIRGIGAEMVLGGIVAFLGIFMPRFQVTSFVVMSVIFVGIVLGRSVSLLVDGVPDESLLRPTTVEAVLAGLNVFCLGLPPDQESRSQGKRSAPRAGHSRLIQQIENMNWYATRMKTSRVLSKKPETVVA